MIPFGTAYLVGQNYLSFEVYNLVENITVIISIIIFIGIISLMHNWVSEYNLKTFGHKRRKDWYEANNDKSPDS